MKTARDPRDTNDLNRVSRRGLLKLAPLAAAGVFLVPRWRDGLLDRGVGFSDWASGKTFRGAHLVPTYPDSELTPLDRFEYNSYDVDEPDYDPDAWRLTVSGLVEKPGDYTLAEIQALPKTVENTRHICVEGWDVIANWGGVRISTFLQAVGADTSARYLSVECLDNYYEVLDVATALHPQSLLCYEMYGKPLERGHGAPLRFTLPTKLGYKSAKGLTKLEVTNVMRPGHRGYWEDQGYSWYAGL